MISKQTQCLDIPLRGEKLESAHAHVTFGDPDQYSAWQMRFTHDLLTGKQRRQ